MPWLHRRPVVPVVLATAVLTASASFAAASAQATPAPAARAAASPTRPTAYPLTRLVSTVSSVGQMVDAAGDLFISSGADQSGGSVTILSTAGAHLKTISGLAGADGLAVSSDGTTVYVADNGAATISAIDTGTLTASTVASVDACPTSLSLVGGRLFYGHGCTGTSTGGVASIDPTVAGGDPVESALDAGSDAPMISGARSVLAVADADAQTISTYTAASDGSLTLLGSATEPGNQPPNDLAVTSDGGTLLTATGGVLGISAFNTQTMGATSYGGASSPEAVAADPSGAHVVAGFSSDERTVQLFDQSSRAVTWQRYGATTDPATWKQDQDDVAAVPGSFTFSRSGGEVFGLMTQTGTGGDYLFASKIETTPTSIALSVPRVGHNQPHLATAVVKGAPHASVAFSGLSAGSTIPTSLGAVTASAKGVAKLRFRSTYSGTLTAAVDGTPSLLPSHVTARFTAKSTTTSRLVGHHHVQYGIAFFASYKKINVLFKTTPTEPNRATVSLFQEKSLHGWHTVKKLHGYESTYGLRVFFTSGPPGVELRVRLIVPTDIYSRGSVANSHPFEVR